MSLTIEHFNDCTIKDFYETMLHAATKMDQHLDVMLTDNPSSGTYIEAKCLYNDWSNTYDAAHDALTNKFGKTMLRQIVKMIESDLALAAQRRKLFAWFL